VVFSKVSWGISGDFDCWKHMTVERKDVSACIRMCDYLEAYHEANTSVSSNKKLHSTSNYLTRARRHCF